jgi:P27 family predicted phage terminase small subunit
MAKRGRPRTPRAVSELLGNPGKRQLRNEPTPLRRNPPKAPAWLSPYALAEWRRVVDELAAMGLAAEIDQAAIAAYCETVATMQTAHELVASMAEGDASKGLLARMPVSGAVVMSPALAIAVRARRDVLAAAAQLGLSAQGRAGLDAQEGATEADEIIRKYFARGTDG